MNNKWYILLLVLFISCEDENKDLKEDSNEELILLGVEADNWVRTKYGGCDIDWGVGDIQWYPALSNGLDWLGLSEMLEDEWTVYLDYILRSDINDTRHVLRHEFRHLRGCDKGIDGNGYEGTMGEYYEWRLCE